MSSNTDNILNRYTDIASLIRILRRKEITLLSPQSWEDKNDSKYLSIYKEKKNLKSLLALCFTDAPETNHHWKVFAPGSSGVCIRFNKRRLLRSLDNQNGYDHEYVIYEEIDTLEKKPPKTQQLPFLKRYPFRDENEYRIIFKDEVKVRQYKHIKININCINNIILSPHLNKSLVAALKETLKSIEGCERLKIHKTTINDSRRWVNCGKESV